MIWAAALSRDSASPSAAVRSASMVGAGAPAGPRDDDADDGRIALSLTGSGDLVSHPPVQALSWSGRLR